MTDEEVIKFVRKQYGKDFGKSLQKILADDSRFANYLRDHFPLEMKETK